MITVDSNMCPVGCKYCAVSQIDCRRSLWNKSTLIGINKAVTFINPPPDITNKAEVERFYNLDPGLFEGDILCFNAISDPFWQKYHCELDYFLCTFNKVAKIMTCVTKMPVPEKLMEKLSSYRNFRLIVSITGLEQLEKTTTKSRLKTLELAKKYKVEAFPLCHPYIACMTDLGFLSALKALGYNEIDIKGLRYNPRFNEWLPENAVHLYEGSDEKEILINDFEEELNKSGLKKVSLKEWYKKQELRTPSLDYETARLKVTEVFKMANITSSDTDKQVFDAAVQRRL